MNLSRVTRAALLVALLTPLLNCGSDDGRFVVNERVSISVDPPSVNFAAVAIFSEAVQTVTITHNGDEGVLRLPSVTLETTSQDLAIDPPGATELQVGESTTLTVRFEPKDNRADVGQIRIVNNAGDDVLVPVNGPAPVGTLVSIPNPIAFGAIEGGGSSELAVRIVNAGADSLNITAVSLRTDSSTDFTASAPRDEDGNPLTTPFGLMPQQSFFVDVTYMPTRGGGDQGHLVVVSDAAEDPRLEVPISGTELGPEIVVSPGQVDLGFVDIGGHAEGEIRIKNEGTEPLTISSIAPAPGSNEELSVIDLPDPLPHAIAPTDTLVVKAAFDPTVAFGAGVQNIGSVAIASDDEDENPVVVQVFARENSPVIVVTPPDVVDFAFTAAGATNSRNVTIFNAGAAPLVLDGLAIESDARGEFAIVAVDGEASPTWPLEVAGGASIVAEVSFTNNGRETDPPGTATLRIDNNDTGPDKDPYLLDLHARRADSAECRLEFAPQVLQFGLVAHGFSKTMQFRIVNTGSGDCVITDNPNRVRTWSCSAGLFGGASCDTSIAPNPFLSREFRLIGIPAPGTIQPGGEVTLIVQFVPPSNGSIFSDLFENESYFGLLGVQALDANRNDGNGDPLVVWGPPGLTPNQQYNGAPNLAGSSGISDLAVIPQEVDFGVITVGCASEDTTVTIYNKGNVPQNITEIRLDEGCSSEFEIVGGPGLPAQVSQGQPREVQVRYVPQDTNTDGCSLVIVTEGTGDQATPALSVPLLGEGTFDSAQTDRFIQITGQEVDVLFVVDNSGSMGDEQDNLARNVNNFIQSAQQWNTSYRLALISTDVENDEGRFRSDPRWVTPTTPNGLQKFADSVKKIGDNGGATEEGLEAAHLALSLPNTFLMKDNMGNQVSCQSDGSCNGAGCHADPDDAGGARYCGGANWGFLRESASLEIVIISDEPDQSPAELSFYVDFFKNIKGFANESLLHVHAIVGTDGTNAAQCESNFGGAAAGTGYVDVVKETGGIQASICSSDYGGILNDIGDLAFGLKKQFFLSRTALPNTVTVTVDGSACGLGWTFDVPSNSIIFDENGPCMPQPDQEIVVDYETLCITP